MKRTYLRIVVGMLCVCPFVLPTRAICQEKAGIVAFLGYPDCIRLQNETTQVVLAPTSGGRVLQYAWKGKNALYLEEEVRGEPYQPGSRANMTAGRFDIGPEKVIPPRPTLWSGVWQGEITGPRSARLTSKRDPATGVQLVREFVLAPKGSHLACTQTIKNVSSKEKQWCHWSRTFAVGNGICLIPLSEHSRFPNHYVMYEGGDQINLRPKDPNIRIRDGVLEILAAPREPKLGMDSQEGWMAYLAPNDLMFVKKFAVFPDRVYNEVAGLTISVWYPSELRVELEPIGPRERLAPGQSASFTEHWYLIERAFPQAGRKVDLGQVRKEIAELK